MMDKFGRKPTLGGSLLVGGAACLTAGLIPECKYKLIKIYVKAHYNLLKNNRM